MCEREKQLHFNLSFTQCYLEVSRAASGPIDFSHPTGDLDQVLEEHGHHVVANAVFSIVSVAVLYSYLAIEARVNYSLYRLWETRHDESAVSKRFLETFGDKGSFLNYKNHNRFRELPDRLKALCELMDYRKPHEVIPHVWQDFMELSRHARHFLVHPVPDPGRVQELLSQMLCDLNLGKWVEVAENLLAFLYSESRQPEPDWLRTNRLIRFEGVRLLPEEGAV